MMCATDYADDYEAVCLRPPAEPRRARKDHRCDDCGRTVEAGETYHCGVWVGGDHDGYSTSKMCAQCVAAGGWLREVCGGHFWPGVLEELEEHWDEECDLRSWALHRLVRLGKAQWRWHGRLVAVEDVGRWVDRALASVPPVASAR